ncbi:hypothetical protein RhiirB3_481831 [Rhizophagus irregularis]|nr:hypothetical protein RhiirB3_481831 [Rhizophagus irregularis]
MSIQFFSKLSQNYIEILEDNEYYDITIEVGKDPNVKIFRAHMIILCHRSSFLRRILTSNKKNNDVLAHIKLSNISPETFQIILRWIDKVDCNSKFSYVRELYLPYKFKLLLRGSRDGFSPGKFHGLCDGKPNTVTFIKVKGTDEILGGYNPSIWKNCDGWGRPDTKNEQLWQTISKV